MTRTETIAGLPARVARRLRRDVTRPWRWWTRADRALPAFLVIGAQRAGSTSLYEYLCDHPRVSGALIKEVHFFDVNAHRSVDWYRTHFPRTGELGSRGIAGEATPYYLFHPQVPGRVRALLPDVRLIALLRDPVDRAYSHYHHEVRLGYETLSFEEALDREAERLGDEHDALARGDLAYGHAHHHFSYQLRGRYADQLERWTEVFPREQLWVGSSERFYREPGTVMAEVHEFLGIEPVSDGAFPKFNAGHQSPMTDALRNRLARAFVPHNQRLYELLGEDFAWTRP